MQRENNEFNASGDIGLFHYATVAACVAKLAAGRHTILKKGLTRARPELRPSDELPDQARTTQRRNFSHMAYSAEVIRPLRCSNNAAFMTFSSAARRLNRRSRRYRRDHMVPLVAAGAVATGAIALVVYLLWPTWGAEASNGPDRLPVSVGGTLFNVPAKAIRMKIQRHSGPQERIDLSFAYPSLDAPAAPKRANAETVEEQAMQPIDRIFLSIAANRDAPAPDELMNSIYPRYFDQAKPVTQDGLTLRAFRDGTPYSGEDLFVAETPSLSASCTRDAATPGMCLSERRIDGADLTFRFPRSWLAQWREVATAMDRLTVQLHGAKADASSKG
jgi:hypothetical protein